MPDSSRQRSHLQAAGRRRCSSTHTRAHRTGNVGLFISTYFAGLTQPTATGGTRRFRLCAFERVLRRTWASNISWLKKTHRSQPAHHVYEWYLRQGGSLEWDFYGGYKARSATSVSRGTLITTTPARSTRFSRSRPPVQRRVHKAEHGNSKRAWLEVVHRQVSPTASWTRHSPCGTAAAPLPGSFRQCPAG